MKTWYFTTHRPIIEDEIIRKIPDATGIYTVIKPIKILQHPGMRYVLRVKPIGTISTDPAIVQSEKMEVLWTIDAFEVIHEFGCRMAEDALALLKDVDPRYKAGIKAKRDWVNGEITTIQLFLAWVPVANAAWPWNSDLDHTIGYCVRSVLEPDANISAHGAMALSIKAQRLHLAQQGEVPPPESYYLDKANKRLSLMLQSEYRKLSKIGRL